MMHQPSSNENLAISTSALPPAPPQGSRSELDVLIDLFAPDGTPQVDVQNRHQSQPHGSHPNLRDVNGELDFSKINHMFASSRNGPHARQDLTFLPNTETDHVQAAVDSVDLLDLTPETSFTTFSPSSNNLMNPGHAYEYPGPVSESTPVQAPRVLPVGTAAVAPYSGPSWNTPVGANGVTPFTANEHGDTVTPFFLDLKRKLELAHRQVLSLQQRCIDLENMLPQNEDQHSQTIFDTERIHLPASQPQAKGSEVDGFTTSGSPTPEDIRRSLEMVAFIDELVWRRSRLGAQYENRYGAENMQALRDRVELWEKVVRTRRSKM